MYLFLSQISEALKHVLKTMFVSDNDVMSEEVRQILSNPDDARKYKAAINKMEKENLTSIRVELSGNRELTLMQ
jgi:hypothetical protein